MHLRVPNDKVTIWKKINVSFIVPFRLGKYSFRLDIFLTQLNASPLITSDSTKSSVILFYFILLNLIQFYLS